MLPRRQEQGILWYTKQDEFLFCRSKEKYETGRTPKRQKVAAVVKYGILAVVFECLGHTIS